MITTHVRKYLHRIRLFSPGGLLLCLRLYLTGRSVYLEGHCNMCGTCCRSISLEGPSGWLRSADYFHQLTEKNVEYRRFHITGKDESGYLLFGCRWITPQGTCGGYGSRLPMCRRFPEKSLVFCGGQLPPGCGYRFREVVPFAKVLQKEIAKEK